MLHSQVKYSCYSSSFWKQNVVLQKILKRLRLKPYKEQDKSKSYSKKRKISWKTFLRLLVEGQLEKITDDSKREKLSSRKQSQFLQLCFQKLSQLHRLFAAQLIPSLRPLNKIWEINQSKELHLFYKKQSFLSFQNIWKKFSRPGVGKFIANYAWKLGSPRWEQYSLIHWDFSK